MKRSEAVEVAGLEAVQWLQMYAHTHNKGVRTEWPDGGSYLKQPAILVEIWDVIADELKGVRSEQRN